MDVEFQYLSQRVRNRRQVMLREIISEYFKELKLHTRMSLFRILTNYTEYRI